jgi:cytoskeletal protein CcmA (bactofilin family)
MKKNKQDDHISTLLGHGTRIEGSLAFTGAIRLDGEVSGKITSDSGTVIIGEKAIVDAKIDVGVAVIKGQVKGQVVARKRIEIFAPAKVTGDIEAPAVSIASGVVFNGNCQMKEKFTPGPTKKLMEKIKGSKNNLPNQAKEKNL